MKKTILLLCALLVLQLAACDKAPENGTASTAPSDSLQSTLHPEDRTLMGYGLSFVETPEGYYYGVNEHSLGTKIYFCPRGGDTFVPLCGKPDCKHFNENCNAFCGDGFGYYDGALYSVAYEGDQFLVYRFNLDGTDHQLVKTVDVSELYPYGGGFGGVFHHGKLFLICQPLDVPELEREDERLIVVDLSDLSATEPMTDFLHEANFPDFNTIQFYKDSIYGRGTGDKSPEYSVTTRKMMELNTATGEASMPVPGFVSGLYVTDSTWYYFEPELDLISPGSGENDPGFREYDVKSGTVKDCGVTVENASYASYDEDYIYVLINPALRSENRREIISDSTIQILSRDYKPVDTLELTNYEGIYAVASDRIFFQTMKGPNGEYTYGTITWYLDKSDIGSHNLELKPINTAG